MYVTQSLHLYIPVVCTDVVGKRAELQSDDLVVRHIAQRTAELLAAVSVVDACILFVNNRIHYRTQHAACLESFGCDILGNSPLGLWCKRPPPLRKLATCCYFPTQDSQPNFAVRREKCQLAASCVLAARALKHRQPVT